MWWKKLFGKKEKREDNYDSNHDHTEAKSEVAETPEVEVSSDVDVDSDVDMD